MMPQNFVAVSISHHRAPVEIRERVQLSEDEIRTLLRELRDGTMQEALIVSTCNRTELFAMPGEGGVESSILVERVLAAKGLGDNSFESYNTYFESLRSREAIEHLFRVIAGIDSQIIGDQQIFAQVKNAFRLSEET